MSIRMAYQVAVEALMLERQLLLRSMALNLEIFSIEIEKEL